MADGVTVNGYAHETETTNLNKSPKTVSASWNGNGDVQVS